MWSKFTILSLFLFFLSREISAQQDSLEYEETDTVVIYKEPVIIKRNQSLQQENLIGPWAIEIFVSPVYYCNYYNVCKNYQNYFCKLHKSTSPSIGYSGGTNLTFIKKKIYVSAGIAYTGIRENFNQVDSSVNIHKKNKFNYFDINFYAGYVIQKKNSSLFFMQEEE